MNVKGDPDDFIPTFDSLPKENNIRKRVQQVIDNLEKNQKMGVHIKRRDIPQYYTRKHSIPVLYLVDLPQYYRLAYTMIKFEIKDELYALMLELMTHDQYNKRFGIFKTKSA